MYRRFRCISVCRIIRYRIGSCRYAFNYRYDCSGCLLYTSIPHLMVSPYYTTLSKETKNDEEVSKYLTDKFNSALWLIKSIEQRRQTIFNVVTAVVEHQKEFLDKGPKYLKTLTLKQVADVMGVHESTVSRSINGKYMQTPRGVFEIRYFFSSGVTGCLLYTSCRA